MWALASGNARKNQEIVPLLFFGGKKTRDGPARIFLTGTLSVSPQRVGWAVSDGQGCGQCCPTVEATLRVGHAVTADGVR
jgi:hypothetical protein